MNRFEPDDRAKRVEMWARRGGYRESSTLRPRCWLWVSGSRAGCTHQYSECVTNDPWHEHIGAWLRRDGSRFLLAHVHRKTEALMWGAEAWALAHGLRIVIDPRDAWYGKEFMPIRYEPAADPAEAGQTVRVAYEPRRPPRRLSRKEVKR